METEPRVRETRAGATVEKGADPQEGTKEFRCQFPFSLLAITREVCVPGKVEHKGYTGLLAQKSLQIPLLSLSPSCSVCLQIVLSASVCVLTSLPLVASFIRPHPPPGLAVPSITAVPEDRISASGGLGHPAAHLGRHVALLLPLCSPPSVAAGLSDRGETASPRLPGNHGHRGQVPACGKLGPQHSTLTPKKPLCWSKGSTLIYVLCSCPFQLTFITGEKTTEIFIQSLELGHSAATRAIKASGGLCGNTYRDG